MSYYYQRTDWEVVDYQLYSLDPEITEAASGQLLYVRGPKPPTFAKDAYFACLGGAQTFGRFCRRPYPNLLAEAIGLPALNLAHGGVSAAYYRQASPKLLDYVNNARFAVIQVMSGRSEENSLFRNCDGSNVTKVSDGSRMQWAAAYRELIATQDESVVHRVITETRQNWLNNYRTLLRAIRVPKILLWFSVRKPFYTDRYDDFAYLFRQFPQLVNDWMIDELRSEVDAYVECASSRGLPHQLTHLTTGKPTVVRDRWSGREWRENDYYPSPEMHENAASELEKQCGRYGNRPRLKPQRGGPLRRAAARFHAGRGILHKKQGQLHLAIAQYRRALQMNPAEAEYYEALGSALTHHHAYWDNPSLRQALSAGGQLDEAIACYQTALELGRRDFSNCLSLGDVLTIRDRFAEAVPWYRQATQLQMRDAVSPATVQSWPPVTVARGPDFLVIGAAKCGTTSLFEYLSAHPRVVPPIRKEIRFFHQMERGLEWYLAHFPPLPGNPAQFITGEASTSYITDYRTPEHVFRHFPRAKLIAILRDPVDRAISHYHDDRRHSDESRSLEEAVDAEIGFLDGATNPAYNAEYWGAGQRGYLSTGLYIHFLERWLKVFPKEQLLVLESKDLQSDPKATMQKVFAFVGVPDNEAGKYDVLLNRGSYAATDDAVRRRLGAFFRPHNQRLEEYLGRKLNWRQ